MTKSEKRGKVKLQNRAKAGEIVISNSDKSQEITVSSRDSYIAQGNEHTTKDKVCTWKEVMDSKHVTLCHTRALTKVFSIGEEQSDSSKDRLTDALHEDSTILPDMIVQQKTHKPIDPKTGLPKTRGVCLASATFNQRINGHLCTVLNGVIQSEPTNEAISTEDKIAKIDQLNKDISTGKIKPKKLTVGSLDVTSLYGSIDSKTAGIIARDKVVKSKMKFEGINYKWALIYLALTMTAHEKVDAHVQGLIPRRKTNKNHPPTIRTVDPEENLDRWWFSKPESLLTHKDKQIIMGCVVQQMLKQVFNSHYYMWDNKIFKHIYGC